MKRVLVAYHFNEEQLKALRTVADQYGDEIVFDTTQEVAPEEMTKYNAVIGNMSVDSIRSNHALEWVQLNNSGADAYAKPGVTGERTVLTSATGAYGTAISEYMVGMLLVMMKKIPAYFVNQQNQTWKDEGVVTTPAGKRILLVGVGNIGMDFARHIRAFETSEHPITLVGVRRRAGICPEGLNEVHPLDELKAEVAKADVIALSLPGTDATYHLFDKEMMAACKEGAFLMNVGRGNVIDRKALLDPAISGRFSGIWIDVAEVEPIPDQDPLFAVPNLLITPHITGGAHLDITVENIFKIVLHNYKAYHGDGEFISVVNKESGYVS
jgi:phosphoglycerate dehydrogenase-like enzyme